MRSQPETLPKAEQSSLVDLAVDAWKFAKLFARVVAKLDAGDKARYLSQARFFQRRVESAAEAAGVRLVSIEDMPFESGCAATALNIEDFSESDCLYVDHMLEPIVMCDSGVVRIGTLILRKI
jgi:hypothetical protein